MADQWHLLTGLFKHGKIVQSYLVTTVPHTCSRVLWDLSAFTGILFGKFTQEGLTAQAGLSKGQKR